MKNKITHIAWSCLLMTTITACTTSNDINGGTPSPKEETPFTLSASTASTKVAWNSPTDLSWEMSDQIELFDASNKRLAFSAISVNDNQAEFEKQDGLDAVTEGEFTVFYPNKSGQDNTYTIDLTGQTQNGNADFQHLKDYTYLKGTGICQAGSTSSTVTFDHLMAEMAFNLTLPAGFHSENIAGVQMQADNNVFYSDWTYTLTNGVANTGTGTSTSHIGVHITGLTSGMSSVNAYMMAIPTSLNNNNLDILLYSNDNQPLAYTSFNGVTVDYAAGNKYNATLSNLTAVAYPPVSYDLDDLTAGSVTEVASTVLIYTTSQQTKI